MIIIVFLFCVIAGLIFLADFGFVLTGIIIPQWVTIDSKWFEYGQPLGESAIWSFIMLVILFAIIVRDPWDGMGELDLKMTKFETVFRYYWLTTVLHAVFRIVRFGILSPKGDLYTPELWPQFVMTQLSIGLMLYSFASFFFLYVFMAEIKLRKQKKTENKEWSKDDRAE